MREYLFVSKKCDLAESTLSNQLQCNHLIRMRHINEIDGHYRIALSIVVLPIVNQILS